MSFLSTVAVTLPERVLLVKLFHENKRNAAAALRKFSLIKNLRKGPLLARALKRMIARFEITGDLRVQPDRGRKPTRSDIVEVSTAIIEQLMDNVTDCSGHAVSRNLSVSYSKVQNMLRKMMHFFPYKTRYNQQLFFYR